MTDNTFLYTSGCFQFFNCHKIGGALIQLLPKILLKVICDDGSFNLGA